MISLLKWLQTKPSSSTWWMLKLFEKRIGLNMLFWRTMHSRALKVKAVKGFREILLRNSLVFQPFFTWASTRKAFALKFGHPVRTYPHIVRSPPCSALICIKSAQHFSMVVRIRRGPNSYNKGTNRYDASHPVPWRQFLPRKFATRATNNELPTRPGF